ncbi:MAG: hypothetical protein WCO00_12645 [Rhodospirillaceae bacterium]
MRSVVYSNNFRLTWATSLLIQMPEHISQTCLNTIPNQTANLGSGSILERIKMCDLIDWGIPNSTALTKRGKVALKKNAKRITSIHSLLPEPATRPVLRVRVPKGEYVLGDPCYTLSDDQSEWEALLKSRDFFFSRAAGSIRNETIYAFHTLRGDGLYAGSDGVLYAVDSGMIGLVPAALGLAAVNNGLCRLVSFDEDTVCKNADGVHMFGNVIINTRW